MLGYHGILLALAGPGPEMDYLSPSMHHKVNKRVQGLLGQDDVLLGLNIRRLQIQHDFGIFEFFRVWFYLLGFDKPRLESHVRYGYIKNHKKTVKNEQARTREPEEYKAEARKAKPQSKSAKKKSKSVKDGQQKSTRPTIFHFNPLSFTKVQE
ncbi:hypothetical protein Tco_0032965 [Tanacetum coccineum]